MKTPEEIVRALAALDLEEDYGLCHVCEGEYSLPWSDDDGFEHSDGCPWLEARSWVAENPPAS